MKKILFTIMVFLMSMTSFSQTESPHLSFKGVPIDGTLNEYVLKMKQKGFVSQGIKDGLALLEGDFAGYKGCTIGVSTLKQKDLVSKIVVIFPKHETWSQLTNNYYNLKEMLMEKYGEPSNVLEKFDGYEPSDDNSKMNYVKLDQCKYYTTFETEKGTIQLNIGHESYSNCFVVLSYFDKINGDVIRAQAIDDL